MIAPMTISFEGASHVGNRRSTNQDAYFIDHGACVSVVADGDGGGLFEEPYGAVVSEIVTAAVASCVSQRLDDA